MLQFQLLSVSDVQTDGYHVLSAFIAVSRRQGGSTEGGGTLDVGESCMEGFRGDDTNQSTGILVGTGFPHGFCLLFGSPEASEKIKCQTFIRGGFC